MKNLLEKISALSSQERYDEAIQLIKSSTSENIDSINPGLLVLEGICILLSNNSHYNPEYAKKLFEMALEIDKDFEEALIELAYYYLNVESNYKKVLPLFKRANEINKRKYVEINKGIKECTEEENSEKQMKNKKIKFKYTTNNLALKKLLVSDKNNSERKLKIAKKNHN